MTKPIVETQPDIQHRYLRRWAILMLLNRINVFAFLVLFAGCIKPPIITPSSQEEASKAINLEQARELSDSIAGNLVKDDRTYVRNAMERGFRDYYDEAAFSSFVDQLFSAYGKPLEVEYKMDELGRKTAMGYDKPMRKFWYALETSKFARGTHFLIVEVVPDGESLAVASFSVVSFSGEVPQNLK